MQLEDAGTAEEGRSLIEGRNAVREAFRAGETVDRLYVQEGLKDGPVLDLIRRAKKADAVVDYVAKDGWTECPRPDAIRV